MLADSDGPTFGDEHRTEQHAALGADGHVAANGGGGCDIGGLVDAGSFGLMFKQLSLEMACGRPSALDGHSTTSSARTSSAAPGDGRMGVESFGSGAIRFAHERHYQVEG